MASKNVPAAYQKHVAVLIDTTPLLLSLKYYCRLSVYTNN